MQTLGTPLKFTMKLWDRASDDSRGPWLRSRFKAIVYDAEGNSVATLHTNEIALVNVLGRRFAEISGRPVEVQPHAYNAVTRAYYNTTSGRGYTYAPRHTEESR
jgi:hypothetical protein